MSNSENGGSAYEASVILLQEGWWDLTGEILQDIARRAFRKKIRVSESGDDDDEAPKKKKRAGDDDPDWIVAGFPMFSVNFRGVLFMILTIPEPYFDDREAAAESCNELRLAKAVREHDTHICVNMVNNGTDLDAEGRQRLLGRFLAYFTWYPGTRAILDEKRQRGRVWDKKLRRALRDAPALEVLMHTPGKEEPVTRVMLSDEDIHRASEEARRRWPEFQAAFARRTEDQGFFVKAPFKDGEHIEHMWTEVLALEDEYVVATVQNDPLDLKKFKKGTKVRFRSKILSDWFYVTRGSEPVGLFVERLLDQKQNAPAEQAGDEDDDFEDEEETPTAVRAGPAPLPARPAPAELPRTRAPRPAPAQRGAPVGLIVGACVAVVLVLAVGIFVAVRFLMQPADEAPPQPVARQDPRPVRQEAPPQPKAKAPVPQQQAGNPLAERPPPELKKPQAPPRRGSTSAEGVTRQFLNALERGDWKAAYEWTTPEYQQRQSLAAFEQAARASRLLDGPRPLRVRWIDPDARRPNLGEVRFEGIGPNTPPVLKVTARPEDSGWWIENLEWVPGAGEQALAQLKAKSAPEVKKETRPNSPHGLANYFVVMLQKGDLAGAYALTTKAYQSQVSRAQFDAAVTACEALRGKDKLGVYFGGSGATLAYNVRPANLPPQTPPSFVVRVRQEDRQWGVERIDWGKP